MLAWTGVYPALSIGSSLAQGNFIERFDWGLGRFCHHCRRHRNFRCNYRCRFIIHGRTFHTPCARNSDLPVRDIDKISSRETLRGGNRYYPALPIHDDGCRPRHDAESLEDVFRYVDSSPSRHLSFGQELPHNLGVFIVDGDELEPGRIEFSDKLVQVRHRDHTGSAPGCPELQHYHLAAQRSPIRPRSRRRLQQLRELQRRSERTRFG